MPSQRETALFSTIIDILAIVVVSAFPTNNTFRAFLAVLTILAIPTVLAIRASFAVHIPCALIAIATGKAFRAVRAILA